MNATQAGWLKVIAAGAGAAQGALMAAESWTGRVIVIAVLSGLVTAGMTAWALYNAVPATPPGGPAPPVGPTAAAVLLGLLLIAASMQGCGDDTAPFYRVATCSDGREAWRADLELVCYEADGTPYGPRPWRPDETPDTACAHCEGFLPPGGAQ